MGFLNKLKNAALDALGDSIGICLLLGEAFNNRQINKLTGKYGNSCETLKSCKNNSNKSVYTKSTKMDSRTNR